MGSDFLTSFSAKRAGILRDDSQSDGRAILASPAENISADQVNELLTAGRGLVFAVLSQERTDAFGLASMYRQEGYAEHLGDACVSVDAREGVTTGISSADRAATLRALAAESPNPRALVRPGHIVPLRARAGGVLVKNALPEGALDLVTGAGFRPAAVMIDLLDAAGSLMRPAEQESLAEQSGWPLLALSDLVRHRLSSEEIVFRVAEVKLPTEFSPGLRGYLYRSRLHSGEHIALVKGEITRETPVLVRVQPEATLTDVFGSLYFPSRRMIRESLARITAAPAGVLLYLRQPAIGCLGDQVNALAALRDGGAGGEGACRTESVRQFGVGAQILRDLGVRRIIVLSQSGRRPAGLEAFGLEIAGYEKLDAEE
jgi:3,4-dihydroxy 2-butanone 4-phosphate synthase / GTP cyclohydrolase II